MCGGFPTSQLHLFSFHQNGWMSVRMLTDNMGCSALTSAVFVWYTCLWGQINPWATPCNWKSPLAHASPWTVQWLSKFIIIHPSNRQSHLCRMMATKRCFWEFKAVCQDALLAKPHLAFWCSCLFMNSWSIKRFSDLLVLQKALPVHVGEGKFLSSCTVSKAAAGGSDF